MENKPTFRKAELSTESTEVHEERKKGHNVTVRNLWIRHTQKKSGEVFAQGEKSIISTSSISPEGRERAVDFGTTIIESPQGIKSYISSVDRTKETLEGIIEGYQQQEPKSPIRQARIREELCFEMPEDFLTLYNQKFSAEKTRQLSNIGKKNEDFSQLSADEQERIAEAAEEPIIREWIDNPNSELAKLYPPRKAAAHFAVLFARRHQRLTEKLYDDSELTLIHITHKAMTESFLASGVLTRKSDGQHITKSEQLGGSLEILGNWESIICTDEKGQVIITINFRGQEYSINNEVLDDLVREGLEDLRKKREEN